MVMDVTRGIFQLEHKVGALSRYAEELKELVESHDFSIAAERATGFKNLCEEANRLANEIADRYT